MSEEQSPVYTSQPSAEPGTRPVCIVKKTSGWKWFWISVLICFTIGCASVLMMGWFIKEIIAEVAANPELQTQYAVGAQEDPWNQLSEVVVKNAPTSEKILMINLEGVFSDGGSSRYGAGETLGVETVGKQLDRAGRDEEVKAVILRIDSPGGEAFTCDLIAEKLRSFYAHYKKPVVAWIGSMGASGGYYVSAPCQWIVAHEMSLTGSIGVISSSFNYRGLLDKVGVKPVVYKSGRFKDMMSSSKEESEISDEERAMMQGLIDRMFKRFKDVVQEGRGQEARKELPGARELAQNWEEYADGRILLGQDAYKVGLVDELGGEAEAVTAAKRLADIQSAKLIRYEWPMNWMGFLKFFSEARVQRVEVDWQGLKLQSQGEMEAGKIYFLPPME